MNNIKHSISSYQLEDFKNHCRIFAKELKYIDSSYELKGRNLVNSLAKACGYTNHGQLVVLAKGYKQTTALTLFLKPSHPMIAKTLSEVTGFKYEVVVAAIIESCMELYNAEWTNSDIEECGDEIWGLIHPDMKRALKSINSLTQKTFESINSLTAPMRNHQKTFESINSLTAPMRNHQKTFESINSFTAPMRNHQKTFESINSFTAPMRNLKKMTRVPSTVHMINRTLK